MKTKMSTRILNSKAYQVFDYICRLIILNVLLIICSFSLLIIFTNIFKNLDETYRLLLLIPTALTLYPSITAITYTIKGYQTNTLGGTFKEFFYGFGKYYGKTVIISILLMVVFVLLMNSYQYFNAYKASGLAYGIGYILTFTFMFIVIMLIIHIPLVLVYFDGLNIKYYLKLSMILAFKDFGITFLCALIVVASIVLSVFFNLYMLIIGFSLPIFLIVLITKKKYLILSERIKES